MKINLVSGIYIIKNKINGRCYIGSSKDNKNRWRKHKYLSRLGTHYAKILQKEWNEFGENNFEFSILELCDKEKLISTEQEYLDKFKPFYNTSPSAGSPRGLKRSLETRLKQSLNHAQLGKLGKESVGYKAIYQYNLDGFFLKMWHGGGEIRRELGFDQSAILKGCKKKGIRYGFFWSQEFLGEKISVIKLKVGGKSKKVGCFDDYGNIVKEFESKKEVALYYNEIKNKKIEYAIYFGKKYKGYTLKYL